MQLTFDSDVEEFRAEFSAFLDEHLPSEADTLERPRSEPTSEPFYTAGGTRPYLLR